MTAATSITQDSRRMIERLIAFDTTSRNSNLELIGFVRDYLKSHGIESELTHDGDGRKANLFATIGPQDKGGIVLSGHTDVVPVDGQDWSSDPFKVEEKSGKLYGRGTCDMKSFIAIALAWVPRFLAEPLKTPVHFAFSYDEEIGCIGVHRLLAGLGARPVKPVGCIVGEPTGMRVVNAHKGKLSYTCHVRGFECHSSLAPHGVNAVEAAARVVAFLAEMAERKAAEGPFDSQYDVPHTTVHTGVINGGTQLNIVPRDCSFDFEFRYLPQEDPEALLKEVQDFAHSKIEPAMKKRRPETGFSWELYSSFPGLDTPPEAEIVTLTKNLAAANATEKVAFGTEAGLFHESGIPTVVCGPGSIDQAHKPDEFISLEQVALCESFLTRLLERLRAS